MKKAYTLARLRHAHLCLSSLSSVVSFPVYQEDEDDELKALITSFKNMTGLWDLDPDDSAWCVTCVAVSHKSCGQRRSAAFEHRALDSSFCIDCKFRRALFAVTHRNAVVTAVMNARICANCTYQLTHL
jgi:hypothetical protein